MKNIIKGNTIENIIYIIISLFLLFLFIITTIYQDSTYIIYVIILVILIIYNILHLRYKIIFEEENLIIKKLKSNTIYYKDIKKFSLNNIQPNRKKHRVVKVSIVLNNDKIIKFTTINENEYYKLRKILKQNRIKS